MTSHPGLSEPSYFKGLGDPSPPATAGDLLAALGAAVSARPPGVRRADLHCHSEASSKTGEAMLKMIRCPESYSRPADVFAQALRRGMDFVTITDHDTVDGVEKLAELPHTFSGEEITCWFPEDGCKMHILVYGHTRRQHEELQARAKNIYEIAAYFEAHNLAHSVAHPIYRQNDKLERWHLERLLLIFKSFEALNGGHSGLHRDAFEPLLDKLTPEEIDRLSQVHGIKPRWPEPWRKGRTGGSDDHGLLNVGRTWTEFPLDVKTPADVLEAIRQGRTRAGGEAGTSVKLAHTLFGVALRYYTRHLLESGGNTPNLAAALMQCFAGERARPTRAQIAKLVIKGKVRKLGKALAKPFRRKDDFQTSDLIKRLFLESVRRRLPEFPELGEELDRGLPPLGSHDVMMRLVHAINRDVSNGVIDAFGKSRDRASLVGMFDAIGAGLAQQFVLAPYYFALFHQNKERKLLTSITRQDVCRRGEKLKIALFTDTFEEVNGVSRFIRDMGRLARASGRELIVHTSMQESELRFSEKEAPFRRNFVPLISRDLPYYSELRLNIPPILEVLEWVDSQQFDVIHVSTPGPMGMLGLLASRMLRVPALATYHADYPAYVDKLTGDHRLAGFCGKYMSWFHRHFDAVFSRSSAYLFNLRDLGVEEPRLRTIRPGIDLSKFGPDKANGAVLRKVGVDLSRTPNVLLYVGRVSIEKNLPLLARAFASLCGHRRDVCLVIAGDGPYRDKMQAELAGLPAHFAGYCDDATLGPLYASATLFAFPSRTDTLGQVVMEAQASGLPAIVSMDGGPKEIVVDKETGLVLPATDPGAWADAIDALLDDAPKLRRFSAAAIARRDRLSIERSFEAFWHDHTIVGDPPHPEGPLVPAAVPAGAVL